MAQICSVCGGIPKGVDCPVCGAPPNNKNYKMSFGDKVYNSLFGAAYWEVQGIDVSKWNGTMDFSITKTKCQYGFIRLGYGTQWKDGACDAFYQNAMANDFPLGVYWYCKIGQDVNQTANSFAGKITTHHPQVDIVIDAEESTPHNHPIPIPYVCMATNHTFFSYIQCERM